MEIRERQPIDFGVSKIATLVLFATSKYIKSLAITQFLTPINGK